MVTYVYESFKNEAQYSSLNVRVMAHNTRAQIQSKWKRNTYDLCLAKFVAENKSKVNK